MPSYKVTDPSTGKSLKLTGDSPPTEAELEQIFSQSGPSLDPHQARMSAASPGGIHLPDLPDLYDKIHKAWAYNEGTKSPNAMYNDVRGGDPNPPAVWPNESDNVGWKDFGGFIRDTVPKSMAAGAAASGGPGILGLGTSAAGGVAGDYVARKTGLPPWMGDIAGAMLFHKMSGGIPGLRGLLKSPGVIPESTGFSGEGGMPPWLRGEGISATEDAARQGFRMPSTTPQVPQGGTSPNIGMADQPIPQMPPSATGTSLKPPPVSYGPMPQQAMSKPPTAAPVPAPITPPPTPSLNPTQLKIEALVAEARKQYPQMPEAQLRQGAAQMVMDEMNRDSAKAGGMGSGLEEAKPGSFAAPTGAATGEPGAEALVEPRGGSRGAWKTGLPVEDPSNGTMVQPLKQPPNAGEFSPGETVKLQDFKSRVGTSPLDQVSSHISPAEGQTMLETMQSMMGDKVKPGANLLTDKAGNTHLLWANAEGKITDFATVNSKGVLTDRVRGGMFNPALKSDGMPRINQKLWEMNPSLMPEHMSVGAMKSWQRFRPTSEPD